MMSYLEPSPPYTESPHEIPFNSKPKTISLHNSIHVTPTIQPLPSFCFAFRVHNKRYYCALPNLSQSQRQLRRPMGPFSPSQSPPGLIILHHIWMEPLPDAAPNHEAFPGFASPNVWGMNPLPKSFASFRSSVVHGVKSIVPKRPVHGLLL